MSERVGGLPSVFPYLHVCNVDGCGTRWLVTDENHEAHELEMVEHRAGHRSADRRLRKALEAAPVDSQMLGDLDRATDRVAKGPGRSHPRPGPAASASSS